MWTSWVLLALVLVALFLLYTITTTTASLVQSLKLLRSQFEKINELIIANSTTQREIQAIRAELSEIKSQQLAFLNRKPVQQQSNSSLTLGIAGVATVLILVVATLLVTDHLTLALTHSNAPEVTYPLTAAGQQSPEVRTKEPRATIKIESPKNELVLEEIREIEPPTTFSKELEPTTFEPSGPNRLELKPELEIEVGVTTKSDLLSKLGEPSSRTWVADAAGVPQEVWSYNQFEQGIQEVYKFESNKLMTFRRTPIQVEVLPEPSTNNSFATISAG